MSDWKAGDIAVCVDDGWHLVVPPYAPRKGSVHRVTEVSPGIAWSDGMPGMFLVLQGVPDGWWEARFRKLNDEPDNAEIIARIKAPIREPQHA